MLNKQYNSFYLWIYKRKNKYCNILKCNEELDNKINDFEDYITKWVHYILSQIIGNALEIQEVIEVLSGRGPDKRGQLSKLAFRGMIGGFCVSVLSALIVGIIIVI